MECFLGQWRIAWPWLFQEVLRIHSHLYVGLISSSACLWLILARWSLWIQPFLVLAARDVSARSKEKRLYSQDRHVAWYSVQFLMYLLTLLCCIKHEENEIEVLLWLLMSTMSKSFLKKLFRSPWTLTSEVNIWLLRKPIPPVSSLRL